MYLIKEEISKELKEKYNMTNFAKRCGLSKGYVSLVMNGKKFKSKPIAYTITKMIDESKEIQDFFDFVEKEK